MNGNENRISQVQLNLFNIMPYRLSHSILWTTCCGNILALLLVSYGTREKDCVQNDWFQRFRMQSCTHNFLFTTTKILKRETRKQQAVFVIIILCIFFARTQNACPGVAHDNIAAWAQFMQEQFHVGISYPWEYVRLSCSGRSLFNYNKSRNGRGKLVWKFV